mgnify:CR=1 FL=1
MKKHTSILKILAELKSKIDFSQIAVIDYWEADLCAIGLQRGNYLIYMNTYNYIAETDLRLDYDLELINGTVDYTVLKELRGINMTKLIAEVEYYLGQSNK